MNFEEVEIFEEKIANGYYAGEDIPYPANPSKSEIEEKVKATFVGTYADIMKEVELQISTAKEEYKKIRDNYYKVQNERISEFKRDMFLMHGVEDNPKAEMAYSIAWEHGHSNGLRDVESYFSELVELIK